MPVLVDGCEAKGHDETVIRYQVPISGRAVLCHDEIVLVTSKKQGAIRQLAESACNPIDFVSAAETVQVPKDLISR